MTIKDKLLESLSGEVGETPATDSIDSILEGTELSPEFKLKLAEAFEAAVAAKAKEEVQVIDEMYESKFNKLDESYSEKFQALDEESELKFKYLEYIYESKFDEHKTSLDESIGNYLEYAATSYITRNELAIESGIKTEITEGFINGLKSLFESNYISVPEGKVDLVSEQDKTIEDLKMKLKEAVDTSIDYKKRLDKSQKMTIVEEFTAKLTDTEAERFKELSEELAFTDVKGFRTKLQTINERYFMDNAPTPKKVDSFITDTPVDNLTESYVDPAISSYVATIDRYLK